MDEAAGLLNPDIASSLVLANQALVEHLTNLLQQIFKAKARAVSKCEFFRSCIAWGNFS